MELTKSLIKRFWSNVDVGKKDDCWEWTGSLDAYGYGQISEGNKTNKKNYKAHRLSWMIRFGEIPENMNICHKCDNPSCMNPNHLFVGTQEDNLRDCREKGRARGGSMPGEKNPNSKLTERQVKDIRNRYKQGGIYQRQLGAEFGVSQAQIGLIVNRKSWRNCG